LTLFSEACSLVVFQKAVGDHLTDCGMATIAWLLPSNPENSSMMKDVV
jgi:hypothetical protein